MSTKTPGGREKWARYNTPQKQAARAERMGISLDDPRIRKARKFYGGRAKKQRKAGVGG